MAADAQLKITAQARLQALVAEQKKVREETSRMAKEFGVTKSVVNQARRAMERQERQAEKLAAENRKLEASNKKTNRSFAGLTSGIGEMLPGMSALSSAGGPVALATTAVAALGTAAFTTANQMSSYVDRQNVLSATTGMTVHEVQALQHAVAAAGGEFGSAQSGLAEFIRRAQDARQKGGEAALAFQQYGISLEGMNGELRPAGDLLRDTLQALDAIEDPTARAAARTQLFGAEAGKALAVLTGAKMEASIEKTRDLAKATDDAQGSSAALDEAYADLNVQFQETVVTMGSKVAPTIVDLTEKTTAALEAWNKWHGRIRQVNDALSWTSAPGIAHNLANMLWDTADAAEAASDALDNEQESAMGWEDLPTQGTTPYDPVAEAASAPTRQGMPQPSGPDPLEEARQRSREAAAAFARDLDAEHEQIREKQMALGQELFEQTLLLDSMVADAREIAGEREKARLREQKQLHEDIGMAGVAAFASIAGASDNVGLRVGAIIAQAWAYQGLAVARAAAEGGLVAGIPGALGMLATVGPAIAQAIKAQGQYDMGGQVPAGAGAPDQGLVRVRGGETILTPVESERRRERPPPQQLVIGHRAFDAMTQVSQRRDALYPRRRLAEVF